jgi:hypothetical protein
MKEFPQLMNNQVALIRAQFSTGHVLDEKLNLATTDNQVVYTIFDDLSIATEFANKLISANDNIECIVYGKEQIVLKYIKPNDH